MKDVARTNGYLLIYFKLAFDQVYFKFSILCQYGTILPNHGGQDWLFKWNDEYACSIPRGVSLSGSLRPFRSCLRRVPERETLRGNKSRRIFVEAN